MTGTEQQLPTRPWTPAPWKQDLEPFHIVIVDGNEHAIATTVHDHNGWESPNPEADAQLIALAPEMAEAIMAWREAGAHGAHVHCACGLCWALAGVDDKLRKIGGDDA